MSCAISLHDLLLARYLTCPHNMTIQDHALHMLNALIHILYSSFVPKRAYSTNII